MMRLRFGANKRSVESRERTKEAFSRFGQRQLGNGRPLHFSSKGHSFAPLDEIAEMRDESERCSGRRRGAKLGKPVRCVSQDFLSAIRKGRQSVAQIERLRGMCHGGDLARSGDATNKG